MLFLSPVMTNQSITVTATADNPDTIERIGTITVTVVESSRTVTVTQAGAPSLEVSTPVPLLGLCKWQQRFFHHYFCKCFLEYYRHSFLAKCSTSPGSSTQSISVTANYDNPLLHRKNCYTLTISGGGITRTVTVTQAGLLYWR